MAKGHKDKVAVITGGANGIGQAFAKRLAEDGVHIAIADIADGRETVKLVEAAGRNALAVVCDVANPESVAAMAKAVQAKFGRADIVVNCAGIYPQQDFAAMTFADWRKVLSINLDGTFLVTAAFVPGMRARQWGRIVSMASSTFGSVTTGFAHYVASKGGIIGFTRGAGRRCRRRRHHRQRHRAGPDALARYTGAQAAPGLRRHGCGIHRRRQFAGDQAGRGAGRSGRCAVVSDQRRLGLHDRADAECGWRAGAVVRGVHRPKNRTAVRVPSQFRPILAFVWVRDGAI